MNSTLSVNESLLFIASGILGLGLCGFYGYKSWSSDAKTWSAFIRRNKKDDVISRWFYGWLWRDVDRHPTSYLWQARIGSLFGIALTGLFLYVGMVDLLKNIR